MKIINRMSKHFSQDRAQSFVSFIGRVSLTAAMLCIPISSASAAVIFSSGNITSDTEVFNTGLVVIANNLGSGATATTVNGVNFGVSTVGLGAMGNGGGDFSRSFAPGSGLDNLLSGLVYQGGGSSSLTLSGLTAGQNYNLQLLLQNSVNSTGRNASVNVQGQNFTLNYGSNANYLLASFAATGNAETVNFGNGSGSESKRMVLNAYVLSTEGAGAGSASAVPEPSTLAIFALGLLGLASRRFKKQA